MLESKETLKEYSVTFENSEGILYTQNLLATSKRHAVLSAMNNNANETSPRFKDFIPISADLITRNNKISINKESLREA